MGHCAGGAHFCCFAAVMPDTSTRRQMPITIIGGYLGAGKTTLVNHLLRYANGKRLAVLVNEFGALPIDADLIEAEEDNLISLAGGCVCCSYGNDMMEAMVELAKMEPRPDHVILEASGVAIPSMIAGSVSLFADYTMDGIVVLADVTTVRDHARDVYLSDTIQRQLANADIILLNKTDLLSQEEVTQMQKWVAKQSPKSAITPCVNGQVPLEVVLQDFDTDISSYKKDGHASLKGFSTMFVQPDPVEDALQFGKELIASNAGLVRAKGFVKETTGEFKTVQVVGKRLDVSPAPSGVEIGVVLIKRSV